MQIETERLLLREFVEADWQAVLAYQRKAEYGAYYEAQERDEASAREFVRWFIRWQTEAPRPADCSLRRASELAESKRRGPASPDFWPIQPNSGSPQAGHFGGTGRCAPQWWQSRRSRPR